MTVVVNDTAVHGPAVHEPPTTMLTEVAVRRPDRWQLCIKRSVDLLFCLVALIVLTVPALVIVALVKATSPGPVLFTQTRVGSSGTEFTLLKFRTMAVGTQRAVASDSALHANYVDNGFKLDANDPRITTLGRFLRKTSLDELPQLVNVFWGDMSVVGIRPLLPAELAQRSPRDQHLYREFRPGLTGLWQVTGRSSIDTADRIRLDREYVEQWSNRRDLSVLVRTPLALARVGHSQ